MVSYAWLVWRQMRKSHKAAHGMDGHVCFESSCKLEEVVGRKRRRQTSQAALQMRLNHQNSTSHENHDQVLHHPHQHRAINCWKSNYTKCTSLFLPPVLLFFQHTASIFPKVFFCWHKSVEQLPSLPLRNIHCDTKAIMRRVLKKSFCFFIWSSIFAGRWQKTGVGKNSLTHFLRLSGGIELHLVRCQSWKHFSGDSPLKRWNIFLSSQWNKIGSCQQNCNSDYPDRQGNCQSAENEIAFANESSGSMQILRAGKTLCRANMHFHWSHKESHLRQQTSDWLVSQSLTLQINRAGKEMATWCRKSSRTSDKSYWWLMLCVTFC